MGQSDDDCRGNLREFHGMAVVAVHHPFFFIMAERGTAAAAEFTAFVPEIKLVSSDSGKSQILWFCQTEDFGVFHLETG